MGIFDFRKKAREEQTDLNPQETEYQQTMDEEQKRLDAEEKEKQALAEAERVRVAEEERKRQEEEKRIREAEEEKRRQEQETRKRMAVYQGFEKYTEVNCSVFADAHYECTYDDIQFTAEIAPPKEHVIELKKDKDDISYSTIAFDVKMIYNGEKKCSLLPRIIFKEKRHPRYGEYESLSKVYLKNGENRYVLDLSNVSTVSGNSEYFGRQELDTAVYPIGPNTVSALKDLFSSGDLDKAIKVGYESKRLDLTTINQIKSFIETCEQAGIFEQQDFKHLNDGCHVLTLFND